MRSRPTLSRAGMSPTRRRTVLAGLERLEGRELLATFAVTNLNPVGDGSLRSAIVQSNLSPGPDTIAFNVAGTIRVGSRALPALADPVNIDGASAPSFAGTPRVTVDFQGSRGFTFNPGSDGSTLSSLSIVRSGGSGVTLNASRITVKGNYIGLLADGLTAAGNRGDGIRINPSSSGNLIGDDDPVSSIDYYNTASVPNLPVNGWQGIRAASLPNQYLMVGTSGSSGILYEGPISGVGGVSYAVNVPGAASTTVYGPNLLEDGVLQLVGTFRTGADSVDSFLYQGTPGQLGDASRYRTFSYPGAQYTIAHSTMGGLVVGNADGPDGDAAIGIDHSFVYNLANGQFTDIVYPGSTLTSAYGIWHNGGTSYTIAGGYSGHGDGAPGTSHAYLVDYDSASGAFSHWTAFDYPRDTPGRDFVAHFQGISGEEKGVYTLAADAAVLGSSVPGRGAVVSVRRNTDNSFGPGQWVDLAYPGLDASTTLTSADSVAGGAVVGIVMSGSAPVPYQADIQTAFQLSNVISSNAGNGIGLYGSSHNQISMNRIGTDSAGVLPRPNGGNGVLVTAGASDNMIGGEATAGNNPTAGVFAVPPLGNLISGNRRNGVLIDAGSTRNQLSGNFVGTDASGNRALGNRLDGVAIVNADANRLIGCTFRQDPFVFYNVLSGNGGNGLRVTDSDDVVVHANFMGVGANNATVVANGGNGLLVSGSSRRTQVGGVIPLGNVISGNARNGIEVRDTASGFVSFNTFGGLFAFGTAAPNQLDGILITSTGGNNLIRTSIISGNLGDGIEIGGRATGVQITETSTGADTALNVALPNGGSGIKISGRAHGNAIGGFQPSIEPQNTSSANGRYGIEIVGLARDNFIYHSVIGETGVLSNTPLGNRLGGILLGSGTSNTTIGGDGGPKSNLIGGNLGDGIVIIGSRGNVISDNQITVNQGYGLFAVGSCFGTVVRRNSIQGNSRGNVDVSRARGIVVIS